MTFIKFIIVSLVLKCLVQVSCSDKGSLTFVIDDTASMGSDIQQVRDSADAITGVILNNPNSQIENIVLVTFNDPEVKLLTVTRSREEFKSYLRNIKVHGGGDCPERSLTGTELGLEKSSPASYLYVFTDDSDDEDGKEVRIQRIIYTARKKQSQIVFIITPNDMCSNANKQFDDYYRIADASTGQVFRLTDKAQVQQVLNYVKETVSGQRTVLIHKIIPPNMWEDIPFTLDSRTEYAIVSSSGNQVVLQLREGPTHTYEPISWTDNIKVMKISVPGDYIIRVKSGGVTSIVVFGRTDFSFSHGFSEFPPKSMEYTTIQPVKGSKPYLAIKLKSKNGDVRLSAVKILDVNGNVLLDNIPLRIVDTEQKIYATGHFDLPTDEAFKISIVGHDMETAETIYRESLPIVPQNPDLDATVTKKNKSPVITIVEPKITVIYEESAELKCIVNAFPKPDIIWIDTTTGSLIPSEVSTIELPYDYISVIVVSNVTSNNTYECKAVNSIGEDSKSIQVETFRKHYFNVLGHIDRTMTLDFIEESRFTCLADAYPPASITWYRDGSEVFNDSATEVSEDGSTLIIKPMQLRKNGEDIECKLANEDESKNFKCHISVHIEAPVIDPSLSDRITKVQGSITVIKCKTVKGRPKPEHRWYFRSTFFKNSKRILLNSTTEDLYLGNVNKFMTGMYTCQAYNIINTDSHTTFLDVVYPPIIEPGAEEVTAIPGKRVNLPCEVSGAPTPAVSWLRNGTEIEDARFDFYKDNRLGFNVEEGDEGLYTCKAINVYGVKVKNIEVKVLIPAFINVPYYSTIERLINDNVTLECDAGGYPKPNISWTHFPKDGRSPEKLTVINDDHNMLIIPSLKLSDAGFYTCTAHNFGDKTANITYEIKVGVKPFIENVNVNKTFTGMDGDAFLSIPCKVGGSPKPGVTWFYNSDAGVGGDLPISVDGASYYQEEDGTLIVKNIDKSFEGYYVCQAKNNHGETNDTYRLIVTDHPEKIRPTSTTKLEEGTSIELKCNLSHSLVQIPRWFKDGKEIGRGKYYLTNVTSSDSGIYTCRVSDITGSMSESQEVKVGSAPRFTNERYDADFDFAEGNPAILECSADGKPSPQVTWYYNGNKVNYPDMVYGVQMHMNNRGNYSCNVTNDMGSIKRDFVIRSKSSCFLPVEDMDEYSPLIYDVDDMDRDINWKILITSEKYLTMEAGDHILLYCSFGFAISSETKIEAVCKYETNFNVKDNTVNFSELKCKTKMEPTIKRTGRTCLSKNNEVIEIGFWIFHKFLSVYEVCFDVLERIPIYANLTMKSLADTVPKTEKWFDNDMIPFDQPSLYDCVRQNAIISSVVHDWPHKSDRCCFAKRQLINPRDLPPGLNQLAAYNPMNVLPHWSTCNSINWDEIERRIRKLSLDIQNLQVWTGRSKSNLDKTIHDKRSMSHALPRYIWKVVRDSETAKSLAIIQVNVPDLKLSEALPYILCTDICSDIIWLRGPKWRDVNNGFTYCCGIQEFQKAFGFDELLDSTNDGILLNYEFESSSY